MGVMTLYSKRYADPEACRQAIGSVETGMRGDVPAADLLKTLDAVGLPDSLACPDEWFRLNFLRMKLLLFHEKNYPEVYRLSESMLPYLKAANLRDKEAMVHAMQGLMFYLIDSPEEAMKCQTMARKEFSGSGRALDSLNNELNICNTLSRIGRESETIRNLQMLERNPEVRKDAKLHCNILMSLHYFTHHDGYAFAAWQEAQLVDNEMMKMKALQNLSGIRYNEGNVEEALEIQKKVYNFFRVRNDPDLLTPLQGIVEIYDKMGAKDSTLAYMRRLVAAQKTFGHAENMALIGRMKAQSEIANLQVNVSLAEAKIALERRKSWIIFIICLAVMLLGALTLVYYRRKAVLEKKLRQSEYEQMAANLQNEKLQNEHSQIRIDSQERELTSKALLVMNKNNMLTDLLGQIQEFSAEGTIGKPQAKVLEKKIREQFSSSSDWDDFTLHFEQMSPDFFRKLKENFPSLTDKDLKLCAYFKLGFSSKQIAQMLSVLPESINTTRYRMRRKMQLSPSETIEDVLRKL